MKYFKRKIENVEYDFECYDATSKIEIGDAYLFFFAGEANVVICDSEQEKLEVNENDRVKNDNKIDFITGFWRNCYKIKSTNFDLTTIR